ncbi:MAG: thioredoxin family protein [Leeuwenhoekiella sp.]
MKTMKILSVGALMIIVSAFAVINFEVNTFSGYGIGDTATNFNLKNVDNSMVSLSDYQDAKGFIVVFTCNTCPFSVAYEDRIMALNSKYAPKGYPVIAINPNNPEAQPEDSFEDMQERAKSKGFEFPYLFDPNQTVYAEYGATRTPHVFILEKEGGNNVVKYIGAIDDNSKDASAVTEKYVESAVDALLAGNEIDVKETKAIGCSIKI